ncbi:MAG: rod shape-determining protein MreC [Holosporaceae bacterium]|jgi:rod shape-determining protein MreC|nr:rod shape-determining protein MreC [Holosporaceae bacterium]
MRKKIAKNGVFFALFRRFRREKIAYGLVLCFGIIAFFHTEIGNVFIERFRFVVNSMAVALDRYCDIFQRNYSNFRYFMSNDVDGVLIQLHNTNIALREELEHLKDLRRENDELRKLLQLKESTVPVIAVARIVGVFSNDFTQSFILNVGERDGAAVNDVVKNSEGLIGRIIEVYNDWSRVLLITDINSCVPVKIGERQVNAIMTGGNSNKLYISTIHEDIPIMEGDIVQTSGYGIPEGISVGKIVKNDEKFMVQSFVNFNSLKYAIVLKRE